MRIRLNAPAGEITATLLDNPTARDLLSMLPCTLTFRDFASTEKVADPPRALSTAEAPAGSAARVGDVTVYAPWGNLAIFYEAHGYAAGLIPVGSIDAGLDRLRSLTGPVTVEALDGGT